MRPLLLLGCSLILAAPAVAQFTRGYVFLGPVPNSSSQSNQASFGIIPTPQPVLPGNQSSNTYTAGIGVEQRFQRHVGAGLDFGSLIPSTGKVLSNTVTRK